MKKIYFYSALVGLGLGTIYISIITSDFVTLFLNKVGGGLNLFGNINGVAVVLAYLGVLIFPLVTTVFLITAVLWRFVGNFKSKYSFLAVVKLNLFFLIGILVALIYLGSFAHLR